MAQVNILSPSSQQVQELAKVANLPHMRVVAGKEMNPAIAEMEGWFGMLVLSRKVGEKIVIGDNVTIVVQRIGKGRVALAIEAPHEIPVLRGELAPFGLEIDGEGPVEFEDLPDEEEVASAKPPAKSDSRRDYQQGSLQSGYPRSAAPVSPSNEVNPLRVTHSTATR